MRFCPVNVRGIEEEIYNYQYQYKKGNLISVHISDIHLGAMDPKYQYEILKAQFLDKIKGIHFDILSLNGDLFHHKFMSNSNAVLYANILIKECVEICSNKNATLVIIGGTEEHDAGQLKLFYTYLDRKDVDIRIVEKTKFEYIKGAKILCIPEEYGKGAKYYNNFLLYSGIYDMVFMHGMLKGAIYQDTDEDIDSHRAPTFKFEDFCNCRGCILSGHVHTSGCFHGYFYYCGSPYRWQFGEEHDKGFLVVLNSLDSGEHYVHFEKIYSKTYITINIDNLLHHPPEDIIKYVEDRRLLEEIDFIRIEIANPEVQDVSAKLELIRKYYKNNSTVKIKNSVRKNSIDKESKELEDQYSEYSYLFDSSMNEYDIFCRYVNDKMGRLFITTEELKEILEEE